MAAPPLTEPAALPKKRNGLAENMPGEGQGKASGLPYGGYLQRGSTAEAACESAAAKRSIERRARGAGGRLLQEGTQRRTEEKFFVTVK